MRSNEIKKGAVRAPNRCLVYATGISSNDMGKPFIGIASSFTDLVPGHIGMRDLERYTERGHRGRRRGSVHFRRSGDMRRHSDGARRHAFFAAFERTDSGRVESVTRAHCLDGLVLLTNCDKITPGMLMAAARLNIPAIVVTAGPMLTGTYKNQRRSLVRDTFEAVGMLQARKISEKELSELEMAACPGAGSCQGLYTANTMACLTEALGMSLPGCGTALAVSAKKRRIAYESGVRVVDLVKQNIVARRC